MQFPPQFTRIGKSHGPDRMTGDLDLLRRHPAEMRIVQRGCGAGGQDIAGPRPVDSQRRPILRQASDFDVTAVPVGAQMIHQTLFKECRADQVETILGQPHHGRFQLDPAAPVQHMGQGNAANLARQTVRDQGFQKAFRIRPRNLDLRKGRNVHDPRALPHRAHLRPDDGVDRRAAERIVVVLLYIALRKPARAFMAEDFLIDRPLLLQALV